MRSKSPQELELHVRELHRLLAHLDGPPTEVDPQPVDGDQFLLVGSMPRGGRAPKKRPDPAPELTDGERLRDVVVRAQLEAQDLVELVVARREHDDRNGALGPQALADLEPVELRDHHVEHDEVYVLRPEPVDRLLAVARLQDAKALSLERIREELLHGV